MTTRSESEVVALPSSLRVDVGSLLGTEVQVSDGHIVPVAATIEIGPNLRMSVPIGAFAQQDGKTRFVATLDVIGLVAAILGIGVGRQGVRAVKPIFRALAKRLAA